MGKCDIIALTKITFSVIHAAVSIVRLTEERGNENESIHS